MRDQARRIAVEARRVAEQLNAAVVEEFAEEIRALQEAEDTSTLALTALSTPHARDVAGRFLDAWQTDGKAISPEAAAMALSAAAESLRSAHENQRVELVWTGPEAQGARLRRTEQALQEVIASASESLLVDCSRVTLSMKRTSYKHALSRRVASINVPAQSGA